MDQNDCRMQKRKNDGSYTELMIPKGTGKEKEKPRVQKITTLRFPGPVAEKMNPRALGAKMTLEQK